MLIALVFALLAILFGGGSPFVIPKLDNYVKTHVVDDGRKTIVLEYLKDAKAKRKAKVKQTSKEIKKLDHLFNSRETTKEEMNAAILNILEYQAESQKANIRVNQESQKNITAEEWDAIMVDISKGLLKTNKKFSKMNTKIGKAYTNWEIKIGKTIADKTKREKALASARNLQAVYLKNRIVVQDELMNKKSIMYQYNMPEEELMTLQNKFIELTDEVLQAVITTHFELVELTTEEEWKKIL